MSYDNLLVENARSKNLIDKLRFDQLQEANAEDSSRRHSFAFLNKLSPSDSFQNGYSNFSQSQPDIVKATTFDFTEPYVGLSFDSSGSLSLLPTPLQNNKSVKLIDNIKHSHNDDLLVHENYGHAKDKSLPSVSTNNENSVNKKISSSINESEHVPRHSMTDDSTLHGIEHKSFPELLFIEVII